MNKALAGLILLLASVSPALAQATFTMPPPAGVMLGGYQVVASCGGASLTANQLAFGTMDTTGTICSAAGGGGGGLSVLDNSAWTNNSSHFTPNGGVFNDSATALGSGDQGTVRLNANREMHVTCDAANIMCQIMQAPMPVIAGTLPSTQTPVTTGSTTKAQSDLNGNLYVNPVSQYPAGATPLTASATGTTAATTATLTGTSTTTVYLCSYSIRANATAAANVQNTITGIISGTRTDQMWVAPLASGLGVDEQVFMPCIPASAVNTAVAVASGAPGTGGNVTVNAAGYYK